MYLHYHNRSFRGLSYSSTGHVSNETIFHYQQFNNLLTASYAGGSIQQGYILGTVNEDGTLDFTYHQIDDQNNFRSGHCVSIPEFLPDGRIRLHERWQWASPGNESGESIVEEIIPSTYA